MEFLLAFLIGGAICLVFQIAMMITKLHPPEMLIVGFSLGAVLLPTGVATWLETVGGAGMGVMVLDAGVASFGGVMNALMGDFTALITVLAIFVIVAALGCIAGALFAATHKKAEAAETVETKE